MHQSKVARSFEAQRRTPNVDVDDSDHQHQQQQQQQRRGVRVPPAQQRSKARIIEDEAEWTDERGRATNRNGVVQRKNDRNKPTPRSESQNYTHRGDCIIVIIIIIIIVA